MDVMEMRRSLLQRKIMPSIINLCPVATGTEIAANWQIINAAYAYTLTGLEPDTDYTIQVTITNSFDVATYRRLYFYSGTSSGKFIGCGVSDVPTTKTYTTKSSENGELIIQHNKNGLNNAEYAASLINIMVEIGSVAHPFVPYKGN